MNFLLTGCTLFVVLLLTTSLLKAQTTAANGSTITGKLVDATTNKPLDFATVSLLRKPGNQPVKGLQTDIDGNFKLDRLTEGTYQLRITFVSYLTYTKDSIVFTATPKNLALGVIKMRQAKGLLKEVVVTGQRSQVQLTTDKKIFSVEQSLVSQGGSATDLLGSVPSVQVDVEGNVNLRGSNNVRVLINGKPSALTGGNMADILQSIPASSIETIEVITNPSSKYDAEGQSGLINIVLKKNARLGFNGSASISAGNQSSVSGSLNLNYQTSKFNLYTNYSYRKARRRGQNGSDRQNFSPSNNIFFQNQAGDQTFEFKSHNLRSGVDYNINEKTTLSLSNNINVRDINRFQNALTQQSDANRTLLRSNRQNNVSVYDGSNVDYNLDFSKKFKKPQQELTANIGYSTGSTDNQDSLRTNYFTQSALTGNRNSFQNNNNESRQRNLNLQLDYVLPLSKNNRIEMGYRSTFNTNDNVYRVDTALNGQLNNFVFVDTLSRDFDYKEQVHAVYGTYQQQFGKIGLQFGLRAEDAHIRTETATTGTVLNFKQNYFRIYPSVYLSDKITDNQTIQISYTRRVSRPRDRQISPFLDRSNRQNYQQGNPALQPEDTHAFELSYINYYKALTLTSSLYYRLTNNDIQRVQSRYNNTDTITLTRFENINLASNAGYELVAKLTTSTKLDLTGNINAFYRYIQADVAKNIRESSGFSFNGNLTVNYKPVKKLGIQLRSEYEGQQVTAQGVDKPVFTMDAGLRYDITSALSLSGNSRDLFNTNKDRSVFTDAANTYRQTTFQRRSFRTILFTLAYRFGGNNPARQRQRDKTNNDNDADDGGIGGGR